MKEGMERTSPILRMFSLRDFSSNPRSLLSPKRMLSPSSRYVNLWRCRRCCSSAQAIVDCTCTPHPAAPTCPPRNGHDARDDIRGKHRL